MENLIVEVEAALETAATHVEAEAVKVETEVKVDIHDLAKNLAGTWTTIKTDVERACFIHELEALVKFVKQPSAAAPIDPAITQALKDAKEDAQVVEGFASRVIAAITALVHRAWKAV